MIELAHPWFLLLLVALPWLLWPLRHSLAEMTPRQRAVCLAMRAAILLALVLALAGPRLRMPSRHVAVVFAVDDSASVQPDARKAARDFVTASLGKMGSHDSVAVIGFAGDATVWPSRADEPWPPPNDREATDLGGALAFASAIFPPDAAKRLVVLSDGNDTESGAVSSAQKLAASGIEIVAVPLRNAFKPEVLAEKLSAPQRAKSGEPFDVTARIRSNVETKATVKLYQNQFLIAQREVDLKSGENGVAFKNVKADGAFTALEAEVATAQDTLAENNRAQATVSIRGKPRVLIVDSDETKLQPLAAALRAGNIDVETRPAAGLPRTLEDLQPFDLFLLSDVPALQLSREQMELYRSWVQDFGGGFAMLGGENSFGVGGYYQTPVEQMLPVRMEHEDREETPTVAMLIVLDRSGSMAASVAGQTKISLADQGAVFAMQALQPKDLFGVVAVDTQVHNVIPLAKNTDRNASQQRIMSVTSAGGGIYIYTSMVEAFRLLREVNAKIKHVLIFSDAADAEEKSAGEMGDGARTGTSSLDIATAMLANKISTSVVALGQESDKDVAFLKQLAERGSGRFYLTNDALTLPQIFSTETMRVAQSSVVEEPFNAVPAKPSAALEGIDWKQSPLLLGYNATKPKPTADLGLATERGEPLLATWRYGLGQTAAFTSDAKARWASEWLAWPGYGKFWTQLVRALMRKSDQSNFQVTTNESGKRLSLQIDAVTADGSFRNEVPVTVNAIDPDGKAHTAKAEQNAPGSYAAQVDLPARGTTLFSISGGQENDGYTFGYTRSYPREFLTSETNETLLRQIAETGHGKFDPSPDEIFTPPKAAATRRADLTPWFLSAALLLFPVDIWLRRRSWKG